MTKFANLTAEERKIIFLSSLGGALELYDFVIYMFFASVLDRLFFPNKDTLRSLMAVFAVFAIGYFIRPLGGLLFGHFGDKYGRKKTFVITILLMALPTFLIGFLPTEQQVGAFAPLLLISLRIIQGLALGGEIPGAITFASEHVNPLYRGLTCGIIFFGLNVGLVLGSGISVLLFTYLTDAGLVSWGWRIPFIFGGVLGVVSYYLRKHMTETPIFAAYLSSHKQAATPLYSAFRYHWRAILRGMGLTWLGAVIICLLFLYIPTYLSVVLAYPKGLVASLNTVNLLIFSLALMVIGGWSDYTGRRLFLRVGACAFLLFGYPLFYLLAYHNNMIMMLVLFVIAICSACVTGTYPVTLAELFPTPIRYTGVAIAYNFAYAFFGGLAPLVATFLIHITGDVLAPSYYLMVSALACLLATIGLVNRQGQPLK